MNPLSAVLITRNAAAVLESCLDSLAFADEIVVVDSASTDGTRELAARKGARVVQKEWLGFGRQKQFAVEQAKHDWVLCLDADERVSPELARSIRAALAAPGSPVYRMPRRNRFLGRWLSHGEGYPDWIVRLFDRRRARWSEDPVHEQVVAGILSKEQARSHPLKNVVTRALGGTPTTGGRPRGSSPPVRVSAGSCG